MEVIQDFIPRFWSNLAYLGRLTEGSVRENRRPARERLSFSKDDFSSAHTGNRSKNASQTPRSEWRPVATEGVLHSQERRSALVRLSLPKERVPLLQDGVANAESGRLQEVDIQYLEDTMPGLGGNSIPSTSRNPARNSTDNYDAAQDRSPIRTLSEDRVHVSLRLGPLLDSEEEGNLPCLTTDKASKAPMVTDKQAGTSKVQKPSTNLRKRGPRSPGQAPALETIGNELGPVDGYDVDKGRIRVQINGLKPLEMKLDISMPSGEIKQVELEYEGLHKHCFICHALSHDKDDCPTQRAQENYREAGTVRMGVSQSRTIDRLEANRRRAEERKQYRSEAPHWQRPSREVDDWKQDRDFRFNYGARRDPNYVTGSLRVEGSVRQNRRPARERLSFSKDDFSSAHTGNVSHTPSPRPQREGGSSQQAHSQTNRQNSAEGVLHSQERRSALARLSLPKERVPLLQDGVANAESGRLQEVDIQYLEDTLPGLGGNNIPSTSRNPARNSTDNYDAAQDRAPIKTLSEDRVHVSLLLGPLLDSEEEGNLPCLTTDKASKAPMVTDKQAGTSKVQKPSTNLRKRGPRSPGQAVEVKKRRVTKIQNSP
ncbi:hypothetical protein F2Q70_00031007 [Brassica cretica]|uniref:Zinc knuckle CX2CX4HX4C domain-containing protein n=1 Tax=Brassica cretica TaxID=69181 RepID=A0A8S9FH84_BRACR|nr:hypothetical protein F2Q70_00031007 [Brassica cretica]